MKYKVGDKVKITKKVIFTYSAEGAIGFLDSDRISTVRLIKNDRYLLKGLSYEWQEEWLEEVISPVETRWEILDL